MKTGFYREVHEGRTRSAEDKSGTLGLREFVAWVNLLMKKAGNYHEVHEVRTRSARDKSGILGRKPYFVHFVNFVVEGSGL